MKKELILVFLVAFVSSQLAAQTVGRARIPTSQPRPIKIVALGDSFMSGEGADQFISGTNVAGVNECRRATTSYPYLLAATLDAQLVFAACSGARVKDVIRLGDDETFGQYPNSPPDVPGGLKQIEVLRQHADADIVLVSLGGNDVKFANTIRDCVDLRDSCVSNADLYMQRVNDLYQPLLAAFREIRQAAPHATVFAVSYPMLFGANHCRASLFSPEEFRFTEEFVDRLNMVISFTAAIAGIRVIYGKDAFVSRRICEVPTRDAAVNVVNVQRPEGAKLDLGWLHGSFHPNVVGHEMLASLVTQDVQLGRALGNPAPGPDIPEPPPYVPTVQGPPTGPYQFPKGAPCTGFEIAYVLNLVVHADVRVVTVPLDQLRPDSQVCFRPTYGDWSVTRADGSGRAEVRINFGDRHGLGSQYDILSVDEEGYWTRTLVQRE